MPDAPASTPAPASAAPVQQATASTTPAPAATPAPTAGAQPVTAPTTQTATAPAAETKASEQPAKATETKTEAKTEQPAAIELKLPKDSLLSADHVKELADFAKANGIKPEIAQQMLETQSKAVAAHQAKLQAQHVAQVETWDKELTADKDIGGEKIQANMDLGRRALEKFGSPELIETLRSTGYNSFPPLVKLLVNIGKAMSEDRVASGGRAVQSDLRSLYKSMPNA
ncbi:MAG TPA: hypothetical protein DCS97_10880 [Planctomycetes bacterium]|nr:hypothetical protein [Planctomycetota bacterium]